MEIQNSWKNFFLSLSNESFGIHWKRGRIPLLYRSGIGEFKVEVQDRRSGTLIACSL
jgi:hypothetical protein